MTPAYEALTSVPSLIAAMRRAARGKRDRPEVADFLVDAEIRCADLSRRLRMPVGEPGSWSPSPARRTLIRDPKPRDISIVPFPDRVVHHALCRDLVPALGRHAITDSWACRVGKGQHGAVVRARSFCRRWPWVLKADVSRYFASIPHDGLFRLIQRRVPDHLLRARLRQVVASHPGGIGLPVGALTSQHLANAWLDPVDHYFKDQRGIRGYLRYMDDILLFGDRATVIGYREELARLLAALGLALNPRVTRAQPVAVGVPFLGWRIAPDAVRPRPATFRRWRRRMRSLHRALRAGRVSEAWAAARGQSSTAHLATFSTTRLRRAFLARLEDGRTVSSRGGNGPEYDGPRQPRRLLEHRPVQRPGREPQEEHARQPQEQPWPSSREHYASWLLVVLPDEVSLRTDLLSPGVDPAVVPCVTLRRGAESIPPAGGPVLRAGMVGGHTFVLE